MMKIKLIRYWFQFDFEGYSDIPPGLGWGCGVTAYTKEDALAILKEKVFHERPIASVVMCIENVDVSTLDSGHVLPNIYDPPSLRGIWFPSGY